MRYSAVIKADIANGTGFRVTLFVSGCARHCKGCFNQQTWDPCYGKPFDDEAKQKIFKELEHKWCRGLTFLGGEPLSKLSDNRATVISFAKEVKEKFPDKNIWLFSGYTLEEIEADESMRDILKYIDILVDGPFIEELKDMSLAFRGSSNQRIVDLTGLLHSS